MSRYSVTLTDLAEQDVAEAVAWYDKQLPGLGDDFVGEFQKSINKLEENPQLYSFVLTSRQIRKILMARFPYRLHFIVDARVVILSVTHAHRDDAVWKKRVRS